MLNPILAFPAASTTNTPTTTETLSSGSNMTPLVRCARFSHWKDVRTDLSGFAGRLIEVFMLMGLATELKTFPDNEIKKGLYNMQMKKLAEVKKTIKWPQSSNHLPVLTWEQCTTRIWQHLLKSEPC